jgi:predicted CoA-substrate-specific enzyme activase
MITCGVDVGSLTAKAVVFDHAAGRVCGQALQRTEYNSEVAGREVLQAALRQAGLHFDDLAALTATGYGRVALEFATYRLTEITCHARGVHHLLPEVRTVIDIGGQDSKVTRLDEQGRPLDFEMNDRCAAGTGRFLEVMAGALGVDLAGLAELALAAHEPVTLSSTCTVFAESEVVGLLAHGRDRAEVAAGLCCAVAQRVVAMARRTGIEHPVAFTGGVALNDGVRRALNDLLGEAVVIPTEPQLTGALGAALLAAERKQAET